MPMEAVCPKGHRLQITEAHLGTQVQCPTCGEMFLVPKTTPPPVSGANQGSELSALPEINAAAAPGASARFPKMPDFKALSVAWGRPMLMVGLLLVLASRGCNSVGGRGVQRAEQREAMARNRFDDDWEEKAIRIRQKLDALDDKEEPDPDDAEQRTKLRDELSQLNRDRQKAQEPLELGAWRDLEIAARDANARHQMNAYWYEMFFVVASLLLAGSLLIVSWNAEGAERWVCLIMLAIITFSVYVGGIAWIDLPL